MVAPTTTCDRSDDLLTIDQLAERTGVSVRTIRFYSGKGLLPAPRLRGRTGLYDTSHRARLELIGELSALGFTLAAIEKRLERVPHDAGPEELALQLALLTPWTPEDPEDVDAAELARRAGRTLSPDDVRRAGGPRRADHTGRRAVPAARTVHTGHRPGGAALRPARRNCGGARTRSSNGTRPRSPRT